MCLSHTAYSSSNVFFPGESYITLSLHIVITSILLFNQDYLLFICLSVIFRFHNLHTILKILYTLSNDSMRCLTLKVL